MKKIMFIVFVTIVGITTVASQNNLSASTEFFKYKGADVGPLSNIVHTNDYETLTYYVKAKVFGINSDDDSVKGSMFLFDDWENNGVIQIREHKYKLTNVNFNIESNEFMSKLEGDSIMVFDPNFLDKITVNRIPFKSVFNHEEGKKKVYQVIYEGQTLSILKGYKLSVTLGSNNPMLNRTKDEIKKKSKYYVLKNGSMNAFKLSKKSIEKIVGSEAWSSVKSYVKKQNLSFKKEEDVKFIFEFAFDKK